MGRGLRQRSASAGSRALCASLVSVLVAVLVALAATSGSAAPATAAIAAQREQVRDLEAQLIGIDMRAAAAASAHARSRARVASLQRDIARTTADLAEARRGHRIAQLRLADRLVALYQHEPPSMVEVLLTSGGIAGAVDAHQALEQVSIADEAIVRRFTETRERLAATRAELVADRRESQGELAAARTRLAELEQLLLSRRAVLSQARSTLDAMVADEDRRQAKRARERQAALALQQARAERTLRAQANAVATADPAPAPAPAPAAPAPEAAPAPAPAPAPTPSPAPPAPSGGVSEHLASIAQCESGGDPTAVSPSGQYRGKYQFDIPTWRSLGGTGDPAAAPEAEQDRIAAALYAQRGAAPWPICGS